MPPNLLAHYFYLWEPPAVQQAVETAWISASVRRTFIVRKLPAPRRQVPWLAEYSRGCHRDASSDQPPLAGACRDSIPACPRRHRPLRGAEQPLPVGNGIRKIRATIRAGTAARPALKKDPPRRSRYRSGCPKITVTQHNAERFSGAARRMRRDELRRCAKNVLDFVWGLLLSSGFFLRQSRP